MSSTDRGDAFEDRVFSAIRRELESDRLGLSPRHARAFEKKGYYSRDRNAEIVIDVSIEVWLPEAENWSVLWACECKDYSGAVPVSDLEEFKAKLDQIAGVNKKGVLAVSGALQSGALNYARSNGIGVIRLLPDGQVHHVFHFMTPEVLERMSRLDPAEFYRALTIPAFIGQNRNFYAEFGGYTFGDWRSILRHALR